MGMFFVSHTTVLRLIPGRNVALCLGCVSVREDSVSWIALSLSFPVFITNLNLPLPDRSSISDGQAI